MKWFRRLVWGVAGLVWFLWLGYEDQGLTSVIVVAVLLSFAIGLEIFTKWTKGKNPKPIIWFLGSIILGTLVGAAVGPIAVILVLVKVSLHNHAVPEFSIDDVRQLAGQSLNWIAGGALLGAAAGFYKLSQTAPKDG